MPTAGERGWGFGEFPSRLKQVARELAAAAIWHPPRHDATSLDSSLAPLELAPTLDIRSGGALSRLSTLISETTIETFAQATKMQYLEKGIISHNLLFFPPFFLTARKFQQMEELFIVVLLSGTCIQKSGQHLKPRQPRHKDKAPNAGRPGTPPYVMLVKLPGLELPATGSLSGQPGRRAEAQQQRMGWNHSWNILCSPLAIDRAA